VQTLQTAIVAATEVTIFGRCFFYTVTTFMLEEFDIDTGVNVSPWKNFIQRSLSIGIETRL